MQRDTLRVDRLHLDIATLSQYGMFAPDSANSAEVTDSILNKYDRMIRLTLTMDKNRFRRQPAMYGKVVADATLQGLNLRLNLADGAKQDAYRIGIHGFWDESGYGLNFIESEPVVLAYNRFIASKDNRIFYRNEDKRLSASPELSSFTPPHVLASADNIVNIVK